MAQSKSFATFFEDFTEKTKDLFNFEKYNLGRVVEVKTTQGEISWVGKVSLENNEVKPKVTATLTPAWGKLELTEDLRKGLSLEVKIPSFYKNLTLITKANNQDVEITGELKPKNGYYAGKFIGYYNPIDNKGKRVCRTTLSGSVGDEGLKLSVGGKIIIEDSQDHKTSHSLQPRLKDYSIGFLWEPNTDSSYSLTYDPEPTQPDRLNYNFNLWRRLSANLDIATRIQGRASHKISDQERPLVSFASQWNYGGGKTMQSFINTTKEWGIAYKFDVSARVAANIGIVNLLNKNTNNYDIKFGYKFTVN